MKKKFLYQCNWIHLLDNHDYKSSYKIHQCLYNLHSHRICSCSLCIRWYLKKRDLIAFKFSYYQRLLVKEWSIFMFITIDVWNTKKSISIICYDESWKGKFTCLLLPFFGLLRKHFEVVYRDIQARRLVLRTYFLCILETLEIW